MKISKVFLGFALGLVIALSTIGAQASATSNKCEVIGSGLKWGSFFTVKNNTATANFTVKGDNCTMPVTLVVYKSPSANGQPLLEQKVYKYSTKTFGPGVHSLSVKVPDCFYQADLVEGSSPLAPDGTPNFDYQNGQIIDGGLRDFIYGGNKKCVDKPTPIPTPVPTPTQPQPEVTTLPNTGMSIGSIIGLSFAVSVASYAAHMQWQKRYNRG